MVHDGHFPKYHQLGDLKQQKVCTAQGCLAHRENDTEMDSDLGAAPAREEHLFICPRPARCWRNEGALWPWILVPLYHGWSQG